MNAGDRGRLVTGATIRTKTITWQLTPGHACNIIAAMTDAARKSGYLAARAPRVALLSGLLLLLGLRGRMRG